MNFVDRYRTISTVPLPRLQTVDLGKLISDVLVLMENELTNVRLDFTYQKTFLQVDPSLFEQVLINLIKNSLSAVAEINHRQLKIEIASKEKFVVVTISDNGKGIPANVIDKVFIPFFTTRENGSGIGLTLSRQIMHRHGGTIEVKSKEGEGTAFTLRLPRSAATAETN